MNSHYVRRKPYAITPPSRMRHCLRTLSATLIAMLSVCAIPLRSAADALDFRTRPLLAGKASLTEPGFTVRRDEWSHTEPRRHGDGVWTRGVVPAVATHGGEAAWG